ncbi:hypothetical protein [Actinomyces lilanjuaniae]|uniref:hypothetical protein n=1 Tax=Actinomyces lilanjuaniae TaxID=2321394 RepID=UPI0013C42D0F|nr:hypothetical protein [Actinomyces lilanjuaniae]
MNLVTRFRPVLAAGAAAACVALSLGACSISVSSPGGGDSSSQSSQPTQADTDAKATQSSEAAETRTEASPRSAEAEESQQDEPTSQASEVQVHSSADASEQEGTDAVPGARDEEEAEVDLGSADRPGASATITDSDWLFEEGFVDKTVRCDNGPLLLSQRSEEVRVTGDCTTLTVTGAYTVAIAEYADTVVINGDGIEVYVRDVNRVVVSGSYSTVVWAGRTPIIEDTGSGTEARPAESD